MAEEILSLQGIRKYFPVKRGLRRRTMGFVKAVDGINLQVNRGESFGLVGESGSGKTTLARIVIKLLEVDSGRIIFQGQDVTSFTGRETRGIRKLMQMVFQDPFSSLDPRFNVEDIISEGVPDNLRRSRQKQRDRINELLFQVGLPEDSGYRFPHEFSGGERQRIAIARSLACMPRFLILDEAVSSLDVLVQKEILDLLQDLQSRFNLTYLFIFHNLRVVKKICQRVAVMYRGKIVEVGSSKDIFDNPQHPYTQGLLVAALEFKVKSKTGPDFFTEETTGCCYNRYCDRKEARCESREPGTKEVSPGHLVSCHLF